MNCKQTMLYLLQEADGELNDQNKEKLLQHLCSCSRCRDDKKLMQITESLIKSECNSFYSVKVPIIKERKKGFLRIIPN